MTYCCGILVRDGLVMIADTRTNAGLDNVSTFRKLHVFGVPGQRIMALGTSGNLSLSQSVVSTLIEGIENPETKEVETLLNAPTMFQAAQRIGHVIRQVHKLEGPALQAADVQIGEHKYGKPVLDRAITHGVDLYDALKIGLISMDSTMRSNLGVGMPIDILIARRDTCEAELSYRIEPGEPYFHDLRERWSAALRAAHMNIPRPPYGNGH